MNLLNELEHEFQHFVASWRREDGGSWRTSAFLAAGGRPRSGFWPIGGICIPLDDEKLDCQIEKFLSLTSIQNVYILNYLSSYCTVIQYRNFVSDYFAHMKPAHTYENN